MHVLRGEREGCTKSDVACELVGCVKSFMQLTGTVKQTAEEVASTHGASVILAEDG
jgi:hypothetical protein